MNGAGAATRSTRARAAGALAVGALVLAGLLFRLGDAPVSRKAERRTYLVAKHMLENGNWIVPFKGRAPRLKKPPLYYWAAASVARERPLSRFAFRLPSALSALALLGLVFAWGRSLGGFASGAVAALSLLQMTQFWSVGRRGVAEMMLALFACAALFTFDRIYWGGRRRLVPLFFLFVTLAFLAKATTALLLIGLPIALQLGFDRAFRRAWRRDVVAWGCACVCGCLAWYAVVLLRVPGAWPVLREAALLPLGLTPSIGSAEHVQPFWFYAPLLFAVASPAIWLAPLAASSPAATREIFALPRSRFVLLCFTSLLLAFSAIPMKQKHYLAPLLPFLALALGVLVTELHARRPELVRTYVLRLGAVLLALAPFAAAVLVGHLLLAEEGPAGLAFAAGAALLCAALAAFAAARRGRLRAFAAASLAASLVAISVHEASIRVVRDGFQAGERLPGARLERAFAEHPWLRRVYRASE